MRRIFLSIVPILILSGYVFAGTIPTRTGDQNGMFIGSETDQYNAGLQTGIGEGELGVAYPAFNPMVVYSAPEAASATAYKSVAISTATLKANGTAWTLAKGDYTDVITPRNLVFSATFAAGGSTKTINCIATVVGKNQRGESISSSISFSTTTGTGLSAFSTITSVSITCSAATNDKLSSTVTLRMGSGVAIGVPADLKAVGEVLKVIENKALVTTGYTLSLVYDTITFAAAPDGTKNYIMYLKPVKR